MPDLNCTFWHEDFGFLIDRTRHPVVSSTELKSFRDNDVVHTLESSGRLPNLNDAPVASWLLPRLVEATLGGIQLDDQEHLRNDGGCVSLRWVAFTKTLKPRAFFNVLCYSNRIVSHGQCMPNTDPSELMSAFIAPLIEQPHALRKWRVCVTDTDPPTAPGKLGRTYVFGWDGAKFLGTREYE